MKPTLGLVDGRTEMTTLPSYQLQETLSSLRWCARRICEEYCDQPRIKASAGPRWHHEHCEEMRRILGHYEEQL